MINGLTKMKKRINVARKKKTLEEKLKQNVERIFNEKRRWMGADNIMLQVNVASGIWGPPVVGENVYAEAFPFENPPRVWIEVWPDATGKEITEIVCHELAHIKHPELNEESEEFKKKVKACMRAQGK
uniref:M48 family peptidase n=1 Tax=candidate division CPR3 bacterium TaxID=2268181 RepID=A0A7V3N6J1_UNCC3